MQNTSIFCLKCQVFHRSVRMAKKDARNIYVFLKNFLGTHPLTTQQCQILQRPPSSQISKSSISDKRQCFSFVNNLWKSSSSLHTPTYMHVTSIWTFLYTHMYTHMYIRTLLADTKARSCRQCYTFMYYSIIKLKVVT